VNFLHHLRGSEPDHHSHFFSNSHISLVLRTVHPHQKQERIAAQLPLLHYRCAARSEIVHPSNTVRNARIASCYAICQWQVCCTSSPPAAHTTPPQHLTPPIGRTPQYSGATLPGRGFPTLTTLKQRQRRKRNKGQQCTHTPARSSARAQRCTAGRGSRSADQSVE